VRLAGTIDWEFLDQRFASVCRSGAGQPPLPTRLVAGLFCQIASNRDPLFASNRDPSGWAGMGLSA